jgi:hypothetical protein
MAMQKQIEAKASLLLALHYQVGNYDYDSKEYEACVQQIKGVERELSGLERAESAASEQLAHQLAAEYAAARAPPAMGARAGNSVGDRYAAGQYDLIRSTAGARKQPAVGAAASAAGAAAHVPLCPCCSRPLVVDKKNCGVFRCGLQRQGGQLVQLDPHGSQVVTHQNLVLDTGCGAAVGIDHHGICHKISYNTHYFP